MSIVRKAGTTDVSVVIRIVDSTDGTPETGVTAATGGLVLEYRRELEASVSLATIVDLAALTTAHTDKGIKHIGNGYYRLDLVDAACATGTTGVAIHGVATGMVVIGEYIQLVAYDPFDAVRMGLTALPNAAADAAGGLPISDAGGLDLDSKLANTNEVTAARMGALTDWIDGGRLDLIIDAILVDTGTTLQAELDGIQADTEDIQTRLPAALGADGFIKATVLGWREVALSGPNYTSVTYGRIPIVMMVGISLDETAADNAEAFFDGTGYAGTNNVIPTVTTLTGHTPQTADHTANIAAILADTGTDGVVVAAASKTGYSLSAAGIQAVWDALTSALTTVGSIGKLLVDNINATISSRSSHSAADVWTSGTRTLTAATNITSTGGTTVPQTGDSFARLGAPAGASIAADIAVLAADNPNRPTRGVQLSNFPFLMVDATDFATPETGLTVTATISKDGGAFAACTNAAAEVGSGVYKITLTAAEMTADMVVLKFTATGAAQTTLAIPTQPT